jgi:hypothetical protein
MLGYAQTCVEYLCDEFQTEDFGGQGGTLVLRCL